MKTETHTSGPWETSEGSSSIWAKSPLNARVRLADVIQHSSMNGIDSNANAQLMASAPDLLAACKCILAALTQNKTFPYDIEMCKAEARHAIDKATV